jgi:hypothetical protein
MGVEQWIPTEAIDLIDIIEGVPILHGDVGQHIEILMDIEFLSLLFSGLKEMLGKLSCLKMGDG